MPGKSTAKGVSAPHKGAMISVVAADLNDPDAPVRGLFKRSQEIRYARVKISAEEIGSRLKEFFSTVETTLKELPPSIGGLSLDQVTVAVEISAKGTVSLLGTGGEVAGKGGMTFTLKRAGTKQ
jgi:hypothetical protein